MDMQGDWPFPPTLILNADSPGCRELHDRLDDWSGRAIWYSVEGLAHAPLVPARGTDAGKMYRAYEVKLDGEISFRIHSQKDRALPTDRVIRLQLPGAHNVQNALAAYAAARAVGIDAELIVKTLEGFGGIRRRFELRHEGPLSVHGHMLDIVLIDDYAHHPTAIAATLEAAHKRYPGRRLVAVYQPHMFSRTKTFFEQFLSS